MPRSLVEIYRALTIARIRHDNGSVQALVTEARAQVLEGEWQTLLDVESAFMDSTLRGLEMFEGKGYDFAKEPPTPPLNADKILLYVALARGLHNSGIPENLVKAFEVCSGLTKHLVPPVDTSSEDAHFLWWLVHHYMALMADGLRMQNESISSYTALIGRLQTSSSKYPWINALLCLSISNRGVANYAQGNLDHAARDFLHAVQMHSALPPEQKVGIPENNLADLYRFVLSTYRNLFDMPTQKWLAERAASLGTLALQTAGDDPIFLYNEAFRSFQTQDFAGAKRGFERSFKTFGRLPSRPENVAGALASQCMRDIADEQLQGKDSPWRATLMCEAPPALERRTKEAEATRGFLVQALNQHDMFIAGVLTELNLHRRLLVAARTIDGRNSLAVLRRWNSFTPCLPIGEQSAEGGGYFVSWRGSGLIVDPGFDFLRHFFLQGFSLADIDGVLITHAHLDHCVELDSILTLLHERQEELRRLGKHADSRKVSLYLSLGAAMKVMPWVGTLAEKSDIIGSIKVLAPHSDAPDTAVLGGITIQAHRAQHGDILTKEHCLSARLELDCVGSSRPAIASIFFTSDTAWHDELLSLADADAVVAHVGTVSILETWVSSVLRLSKTAYERLSKESDAGSALVTDDIARGMGLPYDDPLLRFHQFFFKRRFPAGEDAARLPEQHLGLTGVIRLAQKFRDNGQVFVVSEFGQELGIFRASIAPTLQEHFGKKGSSLPKFLTGDAGLELRLDDSHVRCHYCHTFVPPGQIREVPSLASDREIQFACTACFRNNIDRIRSDLHLEEIIRQAKGSA